MKCLSCFGGKRSYKSVLQKLLLVTAVLGGLLYGISVKLLVTGHKLKQLNKAEQKSWIIVHARNKSKVPELAIRNTVTSWDKPNLKISDDIFFEPEVTTDFPTLDGGPAIIPHIIHQTYKDERIPVQFSQYVASFRKLNPDWVYYFWTDRSARLLVQKSFPEFLAVWDNYGNNIHRADALRYFVLHEFGGIYADLDVECLRPLDNVTKVFSAIFPPEPVEHSARFHLPFLIGNAIMLSKPRHPFLKYMIENLPSYQPMVNLIDVAGPCFVTSQFMLYNKMKGGDAYRIKTVNETNSPFFYKGNMSEFDPNAVYIPNTHYFMHTLNNVGLSRHYYELWYKNNRFSRSFITRRACNQFRRRLRTNETNKFTYTEHHWYQTYTDSKRRVRKYIHLSQIFHNYMIYIP